MILLTLLQLAFASNVLAISLPTLLGPNLVGTVAFEVVDYNRLDPYAPTPQPRDLMISVFYPVQHVRRYSLAPVYTPKYAAYRDAIVGLAPGSAATIVSQAYKGAYLHTSSSSLPSLIFFSPGYAGSRQDYTAAMSNLASHGYIVVGLDHPYDTGFIDYPDGRNTTGINLLESEESITAATLNRVKDAQFVLNALTTNNTIAQKIPGVHGKIKQPKVGFFGHSLGGATAANAMFADSRFDCGVNMDGTIHGPVVEGGLSKPVMFMNTELHNRTSDPSWATLWDKLSGFRLELTVINSTHISFNDQAYLYDELRAIGGIPDLGDLFGTVGGKRILEIEYAYLSAFFDKCLLNQKEPLLEGPSAKYPEVVFWPF